MSLWRNADVSRGRGVGGAISVRRAHWPCADHLRGSPARPCDRLRGSRGRLFALIPIGAVGSLLIFAGTDLAISRRLFDGKPSCLWVIGATAFVTVTVNPALGLILGWIAELIRAAIVRRLIPERP